MHKTNQSKAEKDKQNKQSKMLMNKSKNQLNLKKKLMSTDWSVVC